MIARTWRGTTTAANAEAYSRHFRTTVAPQLKDIAGHRGGYLLRRESDGGIEFLAVTLWDSMAAVKGFAGNNPDVAVIEPEARAVLSAFDDFVRHYEVVYSGVDRA